MSRPAWRSVCSGVRTAAERASTHPRHLVLASLVAGLLAGPVCPPVVLAAAVLVLWLGRGPAVGAAAAVAVLGGAVLADVRLARLDAGALGALVGQRVSTEAVVMEPVRERSGGRRAGRVQLLDGPARGEQAAARVAAESPWPGHLDVGEVIALEGRIAHLGPFEDYQRRRGAAAAIVVSAARATGRRRDGVAGGLDAIRMRAERALARGVPAPEAGLLRGMVLGEDEGLDEAAREEFRRSGLAHLVAASGQNVMLLAILAIAVAAMLGASLRVRLAAALAMVVLYVPLAGAGPSIQRAGVMGVAGLVAALAGRPASRWYAVGLAAAVTLTLNPRVAGEPGWQLSFAAVIALLALAPRLRGWLHGRGWPQALADATAITVSATLGTAPLMALHFEAVSPASLPANILAAPAVAPVMWLGMGSAVVGQASAAAAAPLSALAAYPAAYVEWVAHVSAAPAAASLAVALPGAWALVPAYIALVLAGIGLVWACRRAARLPRGGRRAVAAVGLVAVVGGGLAVAVDGRAPARRPGELTVSFLDVGQGDATLLQRDDATILVDTGPPGGPILRRLREAGVGRLDLLVITHAEADHEGMAPAVLRAHPTRLVLNGGVGRTAVQRALPALAARAGARTVAAEAGQRLRLGGLEFRILWPPLGRVPVPGENPNQWAVVAHVRLGGFDLFLPADAESDALAGVELPVAEAMKVAHHGSDDPGLPAQLARVRPAFAAIEVGARNTYGHPTPSTLRALSAVREVARTDRDGTIRLRVAGGRMRVERSRG